MPTDLLQQEDGDLLLVSGDIVWGESTLQHQRDILLARKGDIRQAPLVGVNAEDYIGDDSEDLLRSVRTEFAKDGMKVKRIWTEGTKLRTDAQY